MNGMRRSSRAGLAASVVLALMASLTVDPARAADAKPDASTLLYIGTHTSGPGQGLFSARLDEQSGHLTFEGAAAEIERDSKHIHSPKGPSLNRPIPQLLPWPGC